MPARSKDAGATIRIGSRHADAEDVGAEVGAVDAVTAGRVGPSIAADAAGQGQRLRASSVVATADRRVWKPDLPSLRITVGKGLAPRSG